VSVLLEHDSDEEGAFLFTLPVNKMPETSAFTPVAVGKDKTTVVMPTHQLSKGCFPPKVIYVIRDTSLPTAFAGSEAWCEFSLPREMGVLDSIRLAFDVTTSAATVLMPTPFWASRVEYYWGSDLVETVYADDLYNEVAGLTTDQYRQDIAKVINTTETGDLKTATVTGSKRFYLPLVSHLNSMRPFVRGFDSVIKVRVYLAPSITAAADTTQANPANTVTLNELQLFVNESQMSRAEAEKTEKLHKAGVVQYAGIFRERQSDALSFNSSGTTPQYLRSFRNDAAALGVYIQAQNGSNSSELVRAPLRDLTLQDAVGNKLTEQLPSDFLKTFVFTDHVESRWTTLSTTSQPNGANFFLVPFTASFEDTLRTGNNYGKRTMTSQERLIYTPAAAGNGEPATPSSAIVHVVAYSYGYIVCKGGKHYVQMASSDEKGCGKNM
jgi:hypothetical protein